jgi:hypothetical protein
MVYLSKRAARASRTHRLHPGGGAQVWETEMLKQPREQFIEGLGVIETTQTDNILRWDGDMVYVEYDVYHNGQMVHSKYKKRVTREVATALLAVLTEKSASN